MPIFEYECEECEAVFQELLRGSENAPPVHCAKCGSARVVRLLSPFAAGSSQGDVDSRGGFPRPRGGKGGGGGCGPSCGCH